MAGKSRLQEPDKAGYAVPTIGSRKGWTQDTRYSAPLLFLCSLESQSGNGSHLSVVKIISPRHAYLLQDSKFCRVKINTSTTPFLVIWESCFWGSAKSPSWVLSLGLLLLQDTFVPLRVGVFSVWGQALETPSLHRSLYQLLSDRKIGHICWALCLDRHMGLSWRGMSMNSGRILTDGSRRTASDTSHQVCTKGNTFISYDSPFNGCNVVSNYGFSFHFLNDLSARNLSCVWVATCTSCL